MTYNSMTFPRGSEWRIWDLHVHTPASFHWEGGENFNPNPLSKENVPLVDKMIHAFNDAEPAVFALMDYWTFDGWFALQHRLKQPDAPKLNKTVFPGIELRLVSPTPYRLNAHVIFSNEISNQDLKDFLSGLKVDVIKKSLSRDCLVQLSHKVGNDKLKKHGFSIEKIADDGQAYLAGATIAEIDRSSYKEAIAQFHSMAIGFMPFDTSNGLADLVWHDHYSYFLDLFKTSPIFESRNTDLRSCFLCKETPQNKSYIDNFRKGLDNTPRLVVSGSDAHAFTSNRKARGYGDFPSGKATWIKADPTFNGLLQAIREPAKRSFIGEKPLKLQDLDQNRHFYIDNIQIEKEANAKVEEKWLDGCTLSLNPGLVAIIGNKGSGKSALADIIGLLGNTQKHRHFSFLKQGRFRGKGKSSKPARYFLGILKWHTNAQSSKNLSDNPGEQEIEQVRYIPQGHFEDLCNSHVSGDDLLQKELESVIFSHLNDSLRQDASSFEDLVNKKEAVYREKLSDLRKNLSDLNVEIDDKEQRLRPGVRGNLESRLEDIKAQITAHFELKPTEVHQPSEKMSEEEKKTKDEIKDIDEKLKESVESRNNLSQQDKNIAQRQQALKDIKERVGSLQKQYEDFLQKASKDLQLIGIKECDLLTFTVHSSLLVEKEKDLETQKNALESDVEKLNSKSEDLNKKKEILGQKLQGPQREYQQYLVKLEEWKKKRQDLEGNAELPDSKRGLEEQLKRIDILPDELNSLYKQRKHIVLSIFDILNSQRCLRESLYQPVQELIQNNELIREEYGLQFKANLDAMPSEVYDSLFSMIKKEAGDFRGEEKSIETFNKIWEKYDANVAGDMANFVEELFQKIKEVSDEESKYGINSLLKKGKKANEVYDFIFSLNFLKPKYTLLFQKTTIEQLSPGQRGALLLIFYLLVDKGQNPVILDQPEENLDNQTVVSLLVPVLSEAKKKRQIIMVTHNPNLAVVCDAEQIIYSEFDRENLFEITYESGSIENPVINRHIVNVLEGTMPAFHNRSIKYQNKKKGLV